MVTIHDAGTPRDTDLPTLSSTQIDRIVDQLLSSPTAARPITAVLEPTTSLAARRAGERAGGKWQRRVSVAAVAAAVAATVVIAAQDHSASTPSTAVGRTPVVQSPASNFDCWLQGQSVLTERAVNLRPTPSSADQVRLGFIGSTLCIEALPNGGGGTTGPTSPAPVPYFGTSGYGGGQYAFGVVDATITRIEFVPSDTSTPARDASELVAFGDQLAFLLPDVGAGVVRFYRDADVVVAKSTTRLPDPVVEPVATGLPCDPTAVGARLNASNFTATDAADNVMFTEVYLEPTTPGQSTRPSDRSLCLLVVSQGPPVSAVAEARGSDQPITHLSATSGNGGQFIWGRLGGEATDLKLTDTMGNTTSLPDEQRDSTRSGQVSFVTFRPDSAPPIISVQAIDDNETTIGNAVQLP